MSRIGSRTRGRIQLVPYDDSATLTYFDFKSSSFLLQSEMPQVGLANVTNEIFAQHVPVTPIPQANDRFSLVHSPDTVRVLEMGWDAAARNLSTTNITLANPSTRHRSYARVGMLCCGWRYICNGHLRIRKDLHLSRMINKSGNRAWKYLAYIVGLVTGITDFLSDIVRLWSASEPGHRETV